MPSSRIIIDNRFGEYTHEVERAIDTALVEAAQVVQEAARGASSPQDYNIGGIQAKTQAELRARPSPHGSEVWVVNRDFRAVWFEKGTYLSRQGKVSAQTMRRRASGTGQQRLNRWGSNQGVLPQKFMRRGLTAGARILMDRIRENLR